MTELEQSGDSPITRATVDSTQPRFSNRDKAVGSLFHLLLQRWKKDELINVPNYLPDSRELDVWLSAFWRTESLLSGVISNVVGLDKNRGWSLTGGRNQVSRFQRVLREAEGGTGWRRYISLQSESFWTTNMGAISEIGRIGKRGPMGALYHVDPTKCALTGNIDKPLEYDPLKGTVQQWEQLDFMRCCSMPMIQEEYNQLGYCAVMRALQFAILMVAIYRHDKEMLFAAIPKGLLLMSGIEAEDWTDSMQAGAEVLSSKEREFYSGLSIFFGGQDGEVDAKLLTLSQLPTGFNLEQWTNILMYGYALCFGYDPREFWPVSGGTMGTGKESEVQALKASGKGGLDFALAYQDNLQGELPPTLLFEFDQRDETGELSEYMAIKAYADAVNAMSLPSGMAEEETLTADQRRILYAEKGFIPEEWTVFEEDVSGTDVDEVERAKLLSSPQILRACTRFPDEPIVRLTWHWKRGIATKMLWPSGAKALEPPTFYSIPGKQRAATPIDPDEVYFEGDDFSITGTDVMRSLKAWDARHDAEFAGLPDAETVES